MDVSVFCFLASYLCAFALECRRLYRRTAWNRALVLAFTAAGLAAHTIYLGNRNAQTDLPPLMSSTHDWVLVLAWLAILVYLFLLIADRELAIGVFLLPLVLGLVGAAYFVSRDPNQLVRATPEMREAAGRVWAMLHAALLVFGIAAAIFGFVLSLMYLVQHRRLKHKHARGEGLVLPNLERLVWLNTWAVVLSVPLLTSGLLAGVALGWLTRRQPESLSFGDPVVLVSGGVWLVLIAFFVWFAATPARRTSGRQVAWLTVVAFGFVLVTLLGLQVLGVDSRHAARGTDERGWGIVAGTTGPVDLVAAGLDGDVLPAFDLPQPPGRLFEPVRRGSPDPAGCPAAGLLCSLAVLEVSARSGRPAVVALAWSGDHARTCLRLAWSGDHARTGLSRQSAEGCT